MMMNPKAFLPAFLQTRHGRLFELIKQSESCGVTHVNKDKSEEAAMLAFRDMAAGSLYR